MKDVYDGKEKDVSNNKNTQIRGELFDPPEFDKLLQSDENDFGWL
jgi:hypothetical protein